MKRTWIFVAAAFAVATASESLYQDEGADWVEGSCATGLAQSPIDIPTELFPEKKGISGKYAVSEHFDFNAEYVSVANKTLILTDHGKSIKIDLAGGVGNLVLSTNTGDVKIYQALQLHFHAPSEHRVNGKEYDLELHIVHKRMNPNDVTTDTITPSADNKTYDGVHTDQLSVLGIFFDVVEGGSTRSSFIDSLNLGSLPSITNATTAPKITAATLDLQGLVDGLSKNSVYYYQGSLTTPPCSQWVEWVVVNDPQPISPSQLEIFQDWWENDLSFAGGFGNNRIAMPLNNRVIYMRMPTESESSNAVWLGIKALALILAVAGFLL